MIKNPKKRRFAATFFLVIFILIVYGPSFYGAIGRYGDMLMIQYVRDYGPFAGLFYPEDGGPWYADVYYRPFFEFQGWLYYQLFDLYYGAHQIAAILQHIVASVLVFAILDRLTDSRGWALLLSMLFAVHVYVSKLALWVPDAQNLLGILTGLVILLLLRPCKGWKWYTALGILLAMAPLTRENGLALIAAVGGWAVHAAMIGHISRKAAFRTLIVCAAATFFYFGLRRIVTGSFFPDNTTERIDLNVIITYVMATWIPVFQNHLPHDGIQVDLYFSMAFALLTLPLLLTLFANPLSVMLTKSGRKHQMLALIIICAGIVGILMLFQPTPSLIAQVMYDYRYNYLVPFGLQGTLSLMIGIATVRADWPRHHKAIAGFSMAFIFAVSIVSLSFFRYRLQYLNVINWLILLAISMRNLPKYSIWLRMRRLVIVNLTFIVVVYAVLLNAKLPLVPRGILATPGYCDPRVDEYLLWEFASMYEVETKEIVMCRRTFEGMQLKSKWK
jgi:hypothetical protein